MIVNRSSPRVSVIPVLAYDDVGEATEWLCNAFGFIERLWIGAHRAQLVFGDGAVIVTELGRMRIRERRRPTPSTYASTTRIAITTRPRAAGP